jgi:hypothetical protein
MSNYTPPTTPMGGPTGGGQFPPQQSWPPPQQQKSGVLKWVLLGCGSFVILGIVVTCLFVWWGWNKAKQAGLDPELLQKKPALAVAKMAVANDSDVEVISSDDVKGTLTIRDKKTGKILTLDVDEADKGKVVFRGEDGEEVVLGAKGQGPTGTGAIEVKTKEGTATISAGSTADLPSWLPPYPGAAIQSNLTARGGDGHGGTIGFGTSDSPETVTHFYEKALKDAGLKVETNSLSAIGKVGFTSVTAEDDGKKRTAVIQITKVDTGTQVTVVFSSK